MTTGDITTFVGFEAARLAFDAHMSPRAKRMAELEAWYTGDQYGGRPSWWSSGEKAPPLMERAPCIVYGLVHTAVDSNRALLLGEGRFPAITSRPAEDDEKFEPETGLGEQESEALDYLICKAQTQLRFRRLIREAFEWGQVTGTACCLFGARAGRLVGDIVKARWCTPTIGPDGRTVEVLEVRYPYFHPFRRPDGKWEVETRVFRRVIDATADTTFLPLPVKRDTDVDAASWQPDPRRSTQHSLGFCPVVWYQHARTASIEGEIDGRAIHGTTSVLDLLFAHDVALSQRHRAAVFLGEPQMAEFGVEPGSAPTGVGHEPTVFASQHGGQVTGDNKPTGRYLTGAEQRRKARRKGPGEVWQYEDPNSRLELLQLSAGALEALDRHAQDLRQKAAERLQVVFMDPENMKVQTISGKALDVLRQRQTDAMDEARDDVDQGLIVPAVNVVLRICQRLREGVRVPGLAKAMPVLDRLAAAGGWDEPPLTLRWGDYSAPNPTEEETIVRTVVQARDAGLATLRASVEKVARVFGYENVGAALEELEREKAEGERRATEIAHGMAEKALPPHKTEPPASGEGETEEEMPHAA